MKPLAYHFYGLFILRMPFFEKVDVLLYSFRFGSGFNWQFISKPTDNWRRCWKHVMLALLFELIIELKHVLLLLFEEIYHRLIWYFFIFVFQGNLLWLLYCFRLYLAYNLFEYVVLVFQRRAVALLFVQFLDVQKKHILQTLFVENTLIGTTFFFYSA